MRHTRRSLIVCLLLGAALLVARASVAAGETAASDPVLDWTASRVQVHVDTVAETGVPVFEGARRRWLTRLRGAGGAYRPDGRPLFFSGRRSGVTTYLTFYPFATWSDLDARSAATKRTEAAVGGEAAVQDYDLGDAALVPPHHSQIWYRLPDLDYVPPGSTISLPEARELRLEMRAMPVGSAPGLDDVWPELQKALAEVRYPVACRAYWNLFGNGELVLAWMTSQAGAPAAPAFDAALAGRPGAAALLAKLEARAPVREIVRLERRDDLSNLPGPGR